MKTTMLPTIAALLIFSACGKDNSTPTAYPSTIEPKADPGKCVLKTLSIPDKDGFDLGSNTGGATWQLFYNGSSIDSTSWDNGNIRYKYTYLNKLPVHLQKYYKSVKGSTYDITYTAAGKPDVVTFYDSASVKQQTTEYQYNGSGEMIRKTYTNLGSKTSSYTTYTYTSGHLTLVDRYNYKGALGDSYAYTYGSDNNKLVLDNSSLEFILHFDDDMESLIYDGLLSDSKLISSITYTEVGKSSITYNITYDLNTNGYPETVKSNGKVIISNQYNCN